MSRVAAGLASVAVVVIAAAAVGCLLVILHRMP